MSLRQNPNNLSKELKITEDLDEVALFLKTCQEYEPKYYVLFTTAIYTGLRRGELLALKWGDLGKANSILRVRRSLYNKKSKHGSTGWKFINPKSETSIRDVDIPESLISLLELQRKKQNETKLKAGERWLKRELIESSWAASRAKETYLSALYHRMVRRQGKKKASVAVGHAILVIAYHILKDKVPYYELGADHFDRLNIRYIKHHFVKRLEGLGYKVTLEPLQLAA